MLAGAPSSARRESNVSEQGTSPTFGCNAGHAHGSVADVKTCDLKCGVCGLTRTRVTGGLMCPNCHPRLAADLCVLCGKPSAFCPC